MLAQMVSPKTWAPLVAGLVLVFAGQAPAQDQINLFDFLAAPNSDQSSELVFTGSGLTNGPGAVGTGFGNAGTGDGNEDIEDQDATGLLGTSPFSISGIPGSDLNIGGGGETTFFDVTMILSLLPASDPVASQPLQSFPSNFLVQELGGGTVEVFSTDPDLGTGGEVLLLSAQLSNAVLSGIENFQSGSIVSASLVYTGGQILTQAGFAPGALGELSFSLVDIEPRLTVNSTTGFLDAFEADATGLFTVIPEPSTALLLFAGGSLLAMRRRDAA